jgi:hypothetical protein
MCWLTLSRESQASSEQGEGAWEHSCLGDSGRNQFQQNTYTSSIPHQNSKFNQQRSGDAKSLYSIPRVTTPPTKSTAAPKGYFRTRTGLVVCKARIEEIISRVDLHQKQHKAYDLEDFLVQLEAWFRNDGLIKWPNQAGAPLG